MIGAVLDKAPAFSKRHSLLFGTAVFRDGNDPCWLFRETAEV